MIHVLRVVNKLTGFRFFPCRTTDRVSSSTHVEQLPGFPLHLHVVDSYPRYDNDDPDDLGTGELFFEEDV